MAVTMTNLEYALKELYPDEELRSMAYPENPWYAMVDKKENAGGELIKVPVVYANPQGRSVSLSTAITNKGNTSGVAFLLTRASDYSIASINRETILASAKDEFSVVESAKFEIDNAFNTCVRSLAKALFRSGSGSLGRINTTSPAGGTTATLLDINDITNFEVGMVLQADTADGGGTVHSGTVTISAINRVTGVITTSANWDTGISAIGASDYLFQQGDYDGMLKGLAAWVPASAPAATAFFGIDRTTDITRLGGNRLTATGMPVEQAVLKGASFVSREGGRPDICLMNDVQYFEMITSLGSKVDFVKQGVTADVWFSGVRVHGPKGPVEVYPDFNCQSAQTYILQKNTWKLYSIGMAPHIFDEGNDQKLLRESTTDGYEARIGYYAQLGCTAPGYNCNATLDAATF